MYYSCSMLKINYCLIMLAILPLAASAQTDTLIVRPLPCPEGKWVLSFSDEFDGSSPDAKKWITWYPYTSDGGDSCAFCRTHGDEGQVFLDENVTVENGILYLTAKKEEAEWMGERRPHTSGMIHSRHPFGYGRYEIRCRMPEGMGFWPALWTFGQLSAEVDIVEGEMEKPDRLHTSIHNWQIGKMLHKGHRLKQKMSGDFNIYAMEWDTNQISFWFNDQKMWQVSRFKGGIFKNTKRCPMRPGKYRLEQVFPHVNEKLYFIAGLGVGNDATPFTGRPDAETVFPASMEIDWFRFYERTPPEAPADIQRIRIR